MQFPPSIKVPYPATCGGKVDRAALFAVYGAKWNSQENRTPMSKTLSGKRVIGEASSFDQWREIQFIGSVAPAAVVVGLDPAEYDLANLIPLHGGAVEPVDQFLLQRCEKTLHARVVKAAMRAAHALPDGTEPGEHRPVLLAGVLAAVVGVQYQPLLITIAVFCQVLFPKKSVGIPFFQQGIFPAFSGHYASLRMRACSIR